MVIKTNVTQLVRGNSITFTTSFYNANNQLVVPSGANLIVSYLVDLVKTSNTISMTSQDNGNTWVGTWSSVGIDPGIVDWFIESTGTALVAEEGSIRVIANDANQ